MNYSESYSKKDDVASTTRPDPPWATGNYSHTLVPQSTHPDLISTPGYVPTVRPYIPNFNATDNAAFTLTPTTEMEMSMNLLTTQVDFTSKVSCQCVGTSIWTYLAVPQNVIDPWSLPTLCMFLSCICHDPSYSPDGNTKSQTSTPLIMRHFQLPPPQRWEHLQIFQHRQILQIK
jgi:hypothetical protein